MSDPFDVNDAVAEIKTRRILDPGMQDIHSDGSAGLPKDIQEALKMDEDELQDTEAFKAGKAKGLAEIHIADPAKSSMGKAPYNDAVQKAQYATGYIAGRLEASGINTKTGKMDKSSKKKASSSVESGKHPLQDEAPPKFLDYPYGRLFAIITVYAGALVAAAAFWHYVRW